MSNPLPERRGCLFDADGNIAIGNRQSQIGHDASALAAYDFPKGTLRERAVRLDPHYARADNYRGSFKFARLGDIQGAIADFDSAISYESVLLSATV
jgi:hypothetical protein